MSAVEVLLTFRAVFISLIEFFESLLIKSANRLGKISEGLRVCQVKHLRLEVLYNPWKDRILSQVLKASLSIGVKQKKVIEIGHTTVDPLLSIVND